MATKEIHAVSDVASIEDWNLVCILMHHSYEPDLSRTVFNTVYKALYSLNDAYGPRGHIPAQGYDWSGIRDSSEAARKEMAISARKILAAFGIVRLSWKQTKFV